VDAAKRHAVNLSNHRSRPVTVDGVRTADLIVVMDASQRRQICERFGRRPRDVVVLATSTRPPVEARTIRDPVDQTATCSIQVYERIARCVREFGSVLDGRAG